MSKPPTARRILPMLMLLVAALLARAAIPQGYMVEADQRGGLVVAICGADGSWTIPLPGKHGRERDDKGDPAGKTCYFAAHSGKAAPPDDPPLAPVPTTIVAAFDGVRASALVLPSARPLPPARGPPLPG